MESEKIKKSTIEFNSREQRWNDFLFKDIRCNDVNNNDRVTYRKNGDIFDSSGLISKGFFGDHQKIYISSFNQMLNKWKTYEVDEIN